MASIVIKRNTDVNFPISIELRKGKVTLFTYFCKNNAQAESFIDSVCKDNKI